MAIAVGADVVVSTLGKKGRVVEARPGGRYRVAVGPMSVWCAESDLAPASAGKRAAKRETRSAPAPGDGGWTAAGNVEVRASEREKAALGSLDLHGMTVEEALRAVGVRLDLAIRAGLDRLEIIHGISGGRLRAAVRGYLAGITSISRVEPDARNPGVTWVYF